jgi:hypothetical protein
VLRGTRAVQHGASEDNGTYHSICRWRGMDRSSNILQKKIGKTVTLMLVYARSCIGIQWGIQSIRGIIRVLFHG